MCVYASATDEFAALAGEIAASKSWDGARLEREAVRRGALNLFTCSNKAFGTQLGYAYGLENQADELGFVSDYAPSDRQEDAWRIHYTEKMFDQVLSVAERNEFLYTHPIADTTCYNVFRWTPAAAAQKKDLTLCGKLFSNLGNGVELRVIRWNDYISNDTRHPQDRRSLRLHSAA